MTSAASVTSVISITSVTSMTSVTLVTSVTSVIFVASMTPTTPVSSVTTPYSTCRRDLDRRQQTVREAFYRLTSSSRCLRTLTRRDQTRDAASIRSKATICDGAVCPLMVSDTGRGVPRAAISPELDISTKTDERRHFANYQVTP